MTPLQQVERELLAHAGALRALARELVGAGAADDLVQETAMRALRRPPTEPTLLFRWLATILRNLASKHWRGERRRRQRERLAARAEALPPAGASLERRDMLRRVTDAVLALPEPYQATLIDRYFGELPPSAIALRDGVPVATVKSRLQRGLTLLRAQLDGEQPDWRAALSGLGVAAPVLLSGTGTLLMTTTTKLLSAAGVLFAAALWFAFAGGNASPPSPPATGADPLAAGAAAAAARPREPAATRLEVPAAVPTPAELLHPFAFELQVTVVDRFGLPHGNAVVFVAPRASALDTWPVNTDADGKVTLRWRGKRPSMAMTIGVRGWQLDQELQEVIVRAGAPQQLVLLVESEQSERHGVAKASGAKGTSETIDGETTDCGRVVPNVSCRACHEGPQLRSVFDGRCAVGPHLHPQACFADLLLPSPPPEPAITDSNGWGTAVALGRLSSVPAPTDAKSTGIVYGVDGVPVEGVRVVMSRPDGTVCMVTTGRGGQFQMLPYLTPGSYAIRAGGGDEGLTASTVELVAGEDVRRELFLDRGAVIRGRAIGPDGAPLAKWRVEYVGADWRDACTTHADGTFILPNLPAGAAQLLLWSRAAGSLPVAIEPSAVPDGSEVVFDLRQRGAGKGTLRLFAALPDGVDRSAAEARVWQQDSGRGAAMAQIADGAFVLGGLAAGFYRVEIGAESCGWRDLGPQWVDGKGLADLGRVELAQPGCVRIVRGEDLDGLPEFYLRRQDCDVLAMDVGAAKADAVALPAGEWLCLWKTRDGALGHATFTVRSSAVVEVRVGGD